MKYWPGSNILKSKNNAFEWQTWKPYIKWTNAPINKTVAKETDITAMRNSITIKDNGTRPGILNVKI